MYGGTCHSKECCGGAIHPSFSSFAPWLNFLEQIQWHKYKINESKANALNQYNFIITRTNKYLGRALSPRMNCLVSFRVTLMWVVSGDERMSCHGIEWDCICCCWRCVYLFGWVDGAFESQFDCRPNYCGTTIKTSSLAQGFVVYRTLSKWNDEYVNEVLGSELIRKESSVHHNWVLQQINLLRIEFLFGLIFKGRQDPVLP